MVHYDLARALDVPTLTQEFAATGRVRISGFLDRTSVEALRRHVEERTDWNRIFNMGSKVASIHRTRFAALPIEKKVEIERMVLTSARQGFQYRYETIKVPNDRVAGDREDALASFATFLSTGSMRDMLRTVTGKTDIAFADAQATAYSPGDFLTRHDDSVAGKNRRAAYTFNLTPQWRPEWGGLLLFHEGEEIVSAGFVPTYNTLTVFSVPAMHSVTEVTRAAPSKRYSITGWLRAL